MMPVSTKQNTYPIPIPINDIQFYHYEAEFLLESGKKLPELTIAYHTFGKLNANKDNVIWICHALTANSDVSDWWSGMFGKGKIYDPEKYFIICANILGSCYGSTCARSISPITGKAYGMNFPIISIRDIVHAHELLRRHLEIDSIDLCIGGSCGGHQVLEMAYLLQDKIKSIALLATSAVETPWAISTHEAQRLAIQADATFADDADRAGEQGLKAARGMALLTYRTFNAYLATQSDDAEKLDDFKAASYIRHQGKKLQQRFYAQAYYSLTKTLDTHNVGRKRGGIAKALAELKMPAFVLSIESDILIPPSQQFELAEHLPHATFVSLDSFYGHDGFLVEAPAINALLLEWKSQLRKMKEV
ncbi:MAG: homoserine O-acetyltransferase [Bacteroidota bacterium]